MLVAKSVVVWRLNPEGSVTTMADDLCKMGWDAYTVHKAGMCRFMQASRVRQINEFDTKLIDSIKWLEFTYCVGRA